MAEQKSLTSELIRNIAVLVQAIAIAGGVFVAFQELVLKDRDAEKDARRNTIQMLERAEGVPLRDEINELNKLTMYDKHTQEMVDFLRTRSDNLRAYISTFAACIYGELCDQDSGLPVFCPLLTRYEQIQSMASIKMIEDKTIQSDQEFFQEIAQLSYVTRKQLSTQCSEWRATLKK